MRGAEINGCFKIKSSTKVVFKKIPSPLKAASFSVSLVKMARDAKKQNHKYT